MSRERKDDCSQNRRRGAAGGEPPAVRSRAPGDQSGHGHGQEFKEKRELGLRRGRAQAAEQQRSGAEPVPGLAGQLKRVARAAGSTDPGCADQREDDGGDGHNGQVSQQRLGRRAGATKAGVDERHAGDGQRRKEQKRESKRKTGFGHDGSDG
jgi:hypothetical protein